MKGQVLDFSIQTNTGVITGEDGNRYQFTGGEWRDSHSPARGMQVDFSVNALGEATQIYVVAGQGFSQVTQNIGQQFQNTLSQHDAKTEESYSPIDWFIKCIKHYADFQGRARRKEYWFFVLCQIGILIVATVIDNILFSGHAIFYGLCALGLFIPSLAAGARRLHDTGRSGWWLLISLIPLVGGLILLFWLASDTKPQPNQWGNPAR